MPYFDAPRILDGNTIANLLQELTEELDFDDFYRFISVGSGSLLVAQEFDGFLTNDLDAYNKNEMEFDEHLRQAIKRVARKHQHDLQLADDWLNDDIHRLTGNIRMLTYRDYLSMIDNNRKIYFESEAYGGAIEITPLSIQGVLICKMLANRDKDLEHIEIIVNDLGLKTQEELLEYLIHGVPSAPNQWYWHNVEQFLERTELLKGYLS